MSGHLTKLQLQKNLSHGKIFLSNTCSALSMSSSENSEIQTVACCRFLQRRTSISPVPPRRLAPRPRPLVPAPHERLAPCGRRRRAAEGAPPRDRRRRRLCGRQRETRRRRRHPAPPKPPELAAWPSTPPERAAALVVNRRARSTLSAAVEPVRSPHRGQTPLRQGQLRLAAK